MYRGGDADATGAIASMLAGACHGMESIPKRWLESLNETITAQCSEQAVELLSLAGTI